MKVRIPSYFNDFKCIASECEDTCCAGWSIVIDDETNNRYEGVNSEFGAILRGNIVKDEDGDNIFILKNGNCSFLNINKFCDIYTNLGEEYLCHTCREFPRYTEEFLDLKERGISLSCPEAARLILGDSKTVEFVLDENNEEGYVDENIRTEVLRDFLECRDIIFEIIDNKDLSLGIKMAVALNFVKEIQNKIDLGDMDEISDVISDYRDGNFLEENIKCLNKYKINNITKYNRIIKYFEIYKEIKHINNSDPLGLNNGLNYLNNNRDNIEAYFTKHREFNDYYKANLFEFKNILNYFVFRYFMKGIFDYDLSAKIKISIISTLIIKELAIIKWIEDGQFTKRNMVDISHMYSKDIEHSEENIEELQELFETKDIFEVDEIINIVLNEF